MLSLRSIGFRLRTGYWLVALLALTLGGCFPGAHAQVTRSPAAPELRDLGTLSVAKVEPPTQHPLRVGRQVELRIEVDYTIHAEDATITLLIQDANDAVIARHEQPAALGSWRRLLQADFRVPDTPGINVAILLHAKGRGFVGLEPLSYRVVH